MKAALTCVIFSAGTLFKPLPEISKDDYIIAADAGLYCCRKSGFVPDLIVGDFDSSKEPADLKNVLKYPVEKDDTDTMLAIKKGLEKGCKEFLLLGATGGARSDHTMANYQALAFLATHGARGFIFDKGFIYTAIYNDSITLNRTKDRGIISVFSLSTVSTGISIRGVQYPLENGSLSMDFPLGVSNHFNADRVEISVENGLLLVGWER